MTSVPARQPPQNQGDAAHALIPQRMDPGVVPLLFKLFSLPSEPTPMMLHRIFLPCLLRVAAAMMVLLYFLLCKVLKIVVFVVGVIVVTTAVTVVVVAIITNNSAAAVTSPLPSSLSSRPPSLLPPMPPLWPMSLLPRCRY